MTANVRSTWTALTPCTHHAPEMQARTTLTHNAHAMCSDGIAASWFAWPINGVPHDPHVRPSVTVSTKPSPRSRRGGVTGYSAKHTNAIAFITRNHVRAHRYVSGRRT